jgi:transcriptional regulator GlxA family with amidase domain
MAYTDANLADVTAAGLARAVGVSDRTLRRLFFQETAMTWRQYLVESRLQRAMVLLAEPGPNVLEVATTVGFASPSAFNRAFARYTGETPSGYRRRVTTAP